MASLVGTPGNDTITGTSGDDVFDLTQGSDDAAYAVTGANIFVFDPALTATGRSAIRANIMIINPANAADRMGDGGGERVRRDDDDD